MAKAPKQTAKDWHPADIKAALAKAGWTVTAVGRECGYANPNVARHVLRVPLPRVEAGIAAILGIPASKIWPSRYSEDGLPRGWRGRRQVLALKIERVEAGTPATADAA